MGGDSWHSEVALPQANLQDLCFKTVGVTPVPAVLVWRAWQGPHLGKKVDLGRSIPVLHRYSEPNLGLEGPGCRPTLLSTTVLSRSQRQ